MVDLNKLAAEIHEAAVKKGFWSVEDAENNHLAKMISELGEVVQADRAGIMYEIERDGAKPEGVVAELADFVMMVLDYMAQYGVTLPEEDISTWVEPECDDALVWLRKANAYDIVLTTTATLVCLANDESTAGCLEMLYAIERWTLLRGYDLWKCIREKMEYNENNRAYLHGRLY